MAKATISYTAEISDLRKKLGDIKGITAASARAMVRDLNKAVRAAEKAQTSQVKGTKAAAKVVDEFGSKAGLAKSSVGDMGQALGMISPELGRAAQAASAAAGGIEAIAKSAKLSGASLAVAGTALAVFAVVLSALAIGYKKTTDEIERESAAKKLAHGINQSLLPGIKKLEQAQIDLKVATGELTEEQAKYLRLQIQARSAVVEFAEAQRSQKEAINESIESTKKWQRLTESGVGPIAWLFEQGAEAAFGFNDKIAQGTTAIEALGIAELKNYEVQKQIFKDQIEALDVITAKKAAAEKAGSKGGKATAVKEVKDESAARQRAAGIMSGLTDHRLSEIERIKNAEDRANADLISTGFATQERLTTIEAEFAQQRIELQKEVADSAQERANETAAYALSISQAYSGAASDIAGATSSALMTIANSTAEGNERQARRAFALAKAVGLAQVAIDTHSAISGINAKWAKAPPVAIVLSIAAAAVGAAQATAIAAQQPSFHSGGPLDLQSDEMNVTARRGEFMLNPQGRAALGDQTLERANAGMGGGSQNVIAVSVYKHTRQVDRWKRDGLDAGDPIARAITAGRLVGHRSNR